MTAGLLVLPVRGIPEVREGHDLAVLIVEAFGDLRDDDIVVVTQKVVSKSEGRVVRGAKDAWVERESRRVVARREDLVIAETRHGFVCANAGVDASNVEPGSLSLLPEDPDASAARIREGLRERAGVDVGVVVSDTFGRPWRRGVVNVAVGCTGLAALVDLRGTPDLHGRALEVTVVALADEVAAAAGLAMGKSDGIPVAVVRGVSRSDPQGAARELVRPQEEDLFRYAPLQAIASLSTAREFGPGPVPREVLTEAVRAALTAPAPRGYPDLSLRWRWVVHVSRASRARMLAAMAEAWVRDPHPDDIPQDDLDLAWSAPILAVPHLSLERDDGHLDEPRRRAERDMLLQAAGAAIQSFMVALHAQGFASAWLSTSPLSHQETGAAPGTEPAWQPVGVVAVGPPPVGGPEAGGTPDVGDHLRFA
jgi:coenzyme F420-0:L-glutamate ligase / coenzyme F420-1:gamma-L-glutamate ligase